MLLFILVIVAHLYFGYKFCAKHAGDIQLIVGKRQIALIAFLSAIISMCLTFAVFYYTPWLKNLPGGVFDGALLVTFPLFIIGFALAYYIVSLGVFAIVKMMINGPK